MDHSDMFWGVSDEAREVIAALDAKLRARALSWEQWSCVSEVR